MIDPKELRIGNWFLNENDEPEQAYEINEDTLNGFKFKLRDGNPIELTPEILEKAGFTGLPHFTIHRPMQISLGRGRLLSISDIGTPNEMMFVEETGSSIKRDIIVVHNYDYDGKLYLHKVQNVFKDFTCKELTYAP